MLTLPQPRVGNKTSLVRVDAPGTRGRIVGPAGCRDASHAGSGFTPMAGHTIDRKRQVMLVELYAVCAAARAEPQELAVARLIALGDGEGRGVACPGAAGDRARTSRRETVVGQQRGSCGRITIGAVEV